MRITRTSLLLLPNLISAALFLPSSSLQEDEVASAGQIPEVQTSTPTSIYLPHSVTSIPSIEPTSSPFYEHIVSAALDEIEEHLHIDLRKRQGAIVTTALQATTIATQVSPTTTYFIQSVVAGAAVQASIVYVQLFSDVPDQWPSPTADGTIGLGTITGEVGVVKTKAKRELPEQTAAAGQMLRIKGREVIVF